MSRGLDYCQGLFYYLDMTTLRADNKAEAMELQAIAVRLNDTGVEAKFDGFKNQLITTASEFSINVIKLSLG